MTGPQRSRDALPIPGRPYLGPNLYDAKDPDASFPPIERLRPPEGAPNVLVILLDDVGLARRARSAAHARRPRPSGSQALDSGT